MCKLPLPNFDALPALFLGHFCFELPLRKKRRLARWRSETLAYRRVALTRRPRHVAQPCQEGQTRVRARHRTRYRRGPGLWLAVHAAHHASRARARCVLVPAPRRRRHGTPRPPALRAPPARLGAASSSMPRSSVARAKLARRYRTPTARPGTRRGGCLETRDLPFFDVLRHRQDSAGFSLVRHSRFSNARRQAASAPWNKYLAASGSPSHRLPSNYLVFETNDDRNASRTRTRA